MLIIIIVMRNIIKGNKAKDLNKGNKDLIILNALVRNVIIMLIRVLNNIPYI